MFPFSLLEGTINISYDSLVGNEAKINNFNRSNCEKLLRMAVQNIFVNSDGKIYKQTDGVAMGSPLGLKYRQYIFAFMIKYGSIIAL